MLPNCAGARSVDFSGEEKTMGHLRFRLYYLARRSLLRVLGPAQLSEADDPLEQLERQRNEVLGPRVHH